MSQYGAIKRYSLIMEKVAGKQYPSLSEIKSYVFEHGFEESLRTIQRDIEALRVEFGVEITYDYSQRGYFIDEKNSLNIDSFLRFLGLIHTAHLFMESLKESKNTLNYIALEAQGNLRGIEHLKPLLFAIKNRRKTRFLHENFHGGRQRVFLMSPYMLKEYQNRWYVAGAIHNSPFLYTFGVDRIRDVEVITETFKPNPRINPSKIFAHTIGLTHSVHKVETILLSFTPQQGNYIKALPLHRSQKILEDNEKELRIGLNIAPNYEFMQKILMYGDTVRIISPQYLVDEIKAKLQATLKKYDSL